MKIKKILKYTKNYESIDLDKSFESLNEEYSNANLSELPSEN